MQDTFFYAAAAVCTLAVGVHIMLGGRQFVAPLLDSELEPHTKWMAYFMWHVASLSMAATAACFALAAWFSGLVPLAAFAVLFAGSVVLLAAYVARKSGLSPLRFPIILLNSGVVTLGILGLFTG